MPRKNANATKRGPKDNAKGCPRAHFHRAGSYCKFCRTMTPADK